MELLNNKGRINFLNNRRPILAFSAVLVIVSVVSIFTKGLNFGIDFTGGTLVEVRYNNAVAIESVRTDLHGNSFSDAVVQHFGTASDVLVRLPADKSSTTTKAAEISSQVMSLLRKSYNEVLVDSSTSGLQQCISNSNTSDCQVQMRRVEFVGPQVGNELIQQGSLAILYTLIGILTYVTYRFEWRFAISSVIALIHDVLITVGVFSMFQFEFSLPVLAAILAIMGYSLNDTIIVFDRIRENFRKIRKTNSICIINESINQILPRTVLTSLTTMFVVLTLLIFGGEVIRSFSIALFIGIIIGTYSSIFVASPVVLSLGILQKDMMPIKKEGV